MITEQLDSSLVLDAVRVTEIAAIAASTLAGRGDEKAADQAAVDAMRTALNALTLADHVEGLTYTGTGDFAGTGNSLANAITGGDEAVARVWMTATNAALGARPIERMATIQGLVDVTTYLDARRAPV